MVAQAVWPCWNDTVGYQGKPETSVIKPQNDLPLFPSDAEEKGQQEEKKLGPWCAEEQKKK
jgi:hypothetical protein